MAAGGSLNQTGVAVMGVVIREERLAEDDRVLGGPGFPGMRRSIHLTRSMRSKLVTSTAATPLGARGVHLMNGALRRLRLVGFGGKKPVGECAEGGLPAHGPPCPAGAGRVKGPGDQVQAFQPPPVRSGCGRGPVAPRCTGRVIVFYPQLAGRIGGARVAIIIDSPLCHYASQAEGAQMLICGIKASHDGGIALIEDNRLVFSIEVEKLGNGRRYSTLGDLDRISEILLREGVDPAAVDQFVVDGWWPTEGAESPIIPTARSGQPTRLPVAPYVESSGVDCLQRYDFSAAELIDDRKGRKGYVSYHHASNHALGSYCTSPFAERGQGALVLVWDGGMIPRLYQVHAAKRSITSVAPLFPIVGNIFPDFCSNFGPFKKDDFRSFGKDISGKAAEDHMRYHLEISGKAMAYAALGVVAEEKFATFDELFRGFSEISTDNAFDLGKKIAVNRDELMPGMSDADIIASLQAYVGRKLERALLKLVQRRFPRQQLNLCIGGGCALNIKWNSLLRATGLFADIWIPPFPNDSGAAIGTACCEMFRLGLALGLEWDVYRGPTLDTGATIPDGWSAKPFDERQVAALLHREGEPVVILNGRAELGPRALGNRSILAPAVDSAMKSRLNDMKGRASYRPVAPVCLESRAAEVFEPGQLDQYMLFEHRVRSAWRGRVPAIIHLDGTARLQTLAPSARTSTAAILAEYDRISGIPVLCNTSANFKGHGFFPDVVSAMEWGRARYIWSAGTLYSRTRGA